LFSAPILVFSAKIGPAIVPEMEVDLEILAFKSSKTMDMKANLLISH
jgi:hypothetical protein